MPLSDQLPEAGAIGVLAAALAFIGTVMARNDAGTWRLAVEAKADLHDCRRELAQEREARIALQVRVARLEAVLGVLPATPGEEKG